MKQQGKVGIGFGVIILRHGKILLGRRHDDPEKADSFLGGAGKWTMPGGKLEFGETFEVGAQREVREETGIKIDKARVLCVNQDIMAGVHFVTLGMICEEFSGEPSVMEPDEIVEWRWFSLDSLPTPLYVPSAKILQNYLRHEFYIAEL